MNYTMILTDKPSDLSLTNNVSGWDKLAGKSQMYSLQVIREAAFPVLLQKLREEYTGQEGPRSCWA